MHLIPDLRQIAIGEQLGRQHCEELFRSKPQDVLDVLAVDHLEEVVAHEVIPLRLPPDVGRVKGREDHLLTADGVHLLTDDVLDLEPDPLAQRKNCVVAGRELAYESAPNEQLVTYRLGVGRVVTKGWYEGL